MPLTGRYRLRRSTIALPPEDGTGSFVRIPEGAAILVQDEDTSAGNEPNRLVEVEWDGKRFRMFAVDIQERGTKIASDAEH